MNEIRRSIPDYFVGEEADRDRATTAEFETLAELLAIPWVAKFAESGRFRRFVLSPPCLMAEYGDGREGWVIGFIRDPDALRGELPGRTGG